MNQSWRQHPTKQQLYGHLPPITKAIKIRRTRHAGHCWRSRDELVSDVSLWTPSHGQAKAGRPAWTYIRQLCVDTGCSPEDLPRAMGDREVWRERIRNIRTDSATWWWWMVLRIHQRDNQTDLQNSLNETKPFLIKIYISHFILERGTQFVVSLRDKWRDILREGTSSCHISSCNLLRAQSSETTLTPLISCVSLARLSILTGLTV